jgi:heat shock protein HslJ
VHPDATEWIKDEPMRKNPYGLVRLCARFALLPIALAVSACSSTPEASSAPTPTLAGTQWEVERIDGESLNGAPLTADFSADGRLNGNSGCNTYSGPFVQTGKSVRIGELLSTRRACTDPALNLMETRVLAILKGQVTLHREGDGKMMVRGNSGSLMLAPRSSENHNAARRATFNCDGTALTVVFAEETADIIWNAGTDTLDERPSESGVWYESQRNVLRGKGKDMTWILTGRSPRHCVAMR